jgi:hypothetical protein
MGEGGLSTRPEEAPVATIVSVTGFIVLVRGFIAPVCGCGGWATE